MKILAKVITKTYIMYTDPELYTDPEITTYIMYTDPELMVHKSCILIQN